MKRGKYVTAAVMSLALLAVGLCGLARMWADGEDLTEAQKEKRAAKLAEESERTKKGDGFVLADAPKMPSLKEGHFADKPAWSDSFDPGWKASKHDWIVATWKQNRTQMSHERAKVNKEGYMVQTVTAGEPYQGGSMQTSREFPFGRWVARVKPTAVPGVLNSMFLLDWEDMTTDKANDGKHVEVDIEFLSYTFGAGHGEVHLAIHAPGHSNYWKRDIPLDFNPSDEFHEWGFDILPDRVVWHVDGRKLAEWKCTDEVKTVEQYELFFNSWTRDRWVKGPPKKDADYHIDWVKFYPYEGEK